VLQSIAALRVMPLIQPFRKFQQRLRAKYWRRLGTCQKLFYGGV
jgi:hypothetical protein